MTGDLSPKRLELLKETLPGLSRVAVLWNAGNPTATPVFKDMESAAPHVDIRHWGCEAPTMFKTQLTLRRGRAQAHYL